MQKMRERDMRKSYTSREKSVLVGRDTKAPRRVLPQRDRGSAGNLDSQPAVFISSEIWPLVRPSGVKGWEVVSCEPRDERFKAPQRLLWDSTPPVPRVTPCDTLMQRD